MNTQKSALSPAKNYFYSIFSGILLAMAYPPMPASMVFCVVLGLALLLYSIRQIESIWQYFIQVFLATLVWNILTIYWIINSTMAGGIFTIIANSLLYTFPFLCLYWARHQAFLHRYAGLIFICAFLGFEFFHFHWEIHFPWLTLGHTLASVPSLIQWYSVTGVAGGSLWLLFLSVVLVEILNNPAYRIGKLALGLGLLLPVLISLTMGYFLQIELKTQSSDGNIIIVQPNIEAYTEKFTLPSRQQLGKMLELCRDKIDSQTRYLLFPETALPDMYWEAKDSSLNSKEVKADLDFLLRFLAKYPHLTLITGLSSYRILDYNNPEPGKRTIINSQGDTVFYASYNTAALVTASGFLDYYHKSKLVPGVEAMPYAKYLNFMNKFTIDLGGITGTLGTDSVPHNLYANPYKLSALICYESIYGDYVSQFCTQGSDALCIITNDGWWGNTSGYRQHAQYGVLRAIENRKYIYRSANTGISYICEPSGKILQSLAYNKAGILKNAFYPRQKSSFYARHPFLIYASASVILGICFLLSGLYKLQKRRVNLCKKPYPKNENS